MNAEEHGGSNYLVCARATARYAVKGSTFDRVCSKCSQRLMIAPSGQRMLRAHQVQTICIQCFLEHGEPADRIALAAKPLEVAQEILTAEPNQWPRRN